MNTSELGRWTRNGILHFRWNAFESVEKLLLTPGIRERLISRASSFQTSESEFHNCRLPWRHGIFFFGPSGSGKTAASRALARLLNWSLLTIPAHEILDSHLFERALYESVTKSQQIIVLEDIDHIIQRMETDVFFTLLDHAMERSEGILWVATSRHPENIPKIQLIRPGRFDESIRLDLPHSDLRKELFQSLMAYAEVERDEGILTEWVTQAEGLTFSHFEELRQMIAKIKIEKREKAEFWGIVKEYLDDQLIAGNRWGSPSENAEDLESRIRNVDPRVLMAALDMTDVFRGLIEKVIGDAADEAKLSQSGDQS